MKKVASLLSIPSVDTKKGVKWWHCLRQGSSSCVQIELRLREAEGTEDDHWEAAGLLEYVFILLELRSNVVTDIGPHQHGLPIEGAGC